MSVRIKYDSTHNVIQPTLVLAKRNGKKIRKLPLYNLVFKDGMNTCSELSFRVNKIDCISKKKKSELTHITPINISGIIDNANGLSMIGKITDSKYTELLNYFKVNSKLKNIQLRFVQNGSQKVYISPIFSCDNDYENMYLSDGIGVESIIKIDKNGYVYINNATSNGFVVGDSCFIELSFDVPISLLKNTFWDSISDFKLIWAKEWDMWFEIYVSLDETDETIKNISAKSLGEAELSQINLYDIEINTETDIDGIGYKQTVLFNEVDHDASLLHRITEKAPHYNFVHVDPSISSIQRTFSFSDITLYDAFQEIAKEINCIFIIRCHTDENGGIVRDISVYDMESYCASCGERGNFLDHCPKCGNENILRGYGEDTNIFISTENLADNITYQVDNGSVKNCFKLEAGDDLMTATITNCNPNGSGYIWYIPDSTKSDMTVELVNKLKDYDELYEYYQNDYHAQISQLELDSYNALIDKYSVYTNKYERISSQIIGYPAIIQAYYDTIDFYYYLKDSLMPGIEITRTNASLEGAKLNTVSISPVAIQRITSATSGATVSNAVLAMVKTIISSSYQVKIPNYSFNSSSLIWSGNFEITNYADKEDSYITGTIAVQITGDYETYVRQRIDKILATKRSDDVLDIIELFSLDDTGFKIELRKYSLERLKSFHDSCQSCLDILIQQGISNQKNWEKRTPNLYSKLYLPYYNKLGYILDEMNVRQNEIDIIAGKYDADGDLVQNGIQVILENDKNTIQNTLNFKNYLGKNLWLEFAAYRREDTYSNQNFISDGLGNKELFDRAFEFIEVAKKDIFKSATLQHSITASLKNLLVMKEFESLVDSFEVGNWLRVKVDDSIYRLRLLEYEIDFNNLDNITITFSDVNSVKDELTDIESVLNQASSMATSYGEVARQAKQGKKSDERLNDWVEKGLALTKMKIIDNADNQDISWDNHGFLCKEYLPITDTYDDKQLKIISKGLYLTDDNWKTSRSGIGNFTFWNPKTQQYEESYGVIADTLVGNLILSEEVGIYNKNHSIQLDENGLTIITDGMNNGTNQSVLNIQKRVLDDFGNPYLLPIMSADTSGNLSLISNITSASAIFKPETLFPNCYYTTIENGHLNIGFYDGAFHYLGSMNNSFDKPRSEYNYNSPYLRPDASHLGIMARKDSTGIAFCVEDKNGEEHIKMAIRNKLGNAFDNYSNRQWDYQECDIVISCDTAIQGNLRLGSSLTVEGGGLSVADSIICGNNLIVNGSMTCDNDLNVTGCMYGEISANGTFNGIVSGTLNNIGGTLNNVGGTFNGTVTGALQNVGGTFNGTVTGTLQDVGGTFNGLVDYHTKDANALPIRVIYNENHFIQVGFLENTNPQPCIHFFNKSNSSDQTWDGYLYLNSAGTLIWQINEVSYAVGNKINQ